MFNDSKYIKWVNNEIKKIPKKYISSDKSNTLKHICIEIQNKNLNCLEFGVFEGGTINLISKYTNKVYGFDSFQGLPEKCDGVTYKGHYKIDNLPEVEKNVELVVGLFEDTLDNFFINHPEDFGLIHIDCDLYSSTKFVFNKLIQYKKLKPGVIIIFDEIINYNKFLEGELKALYEININNNINFKWLGTHGNIIMPKDLEDKTSKFNNWSFKKYRKNGYQQEAAIEILPSNHLGGSLNKTNVDEGVLDYLTNKFNVKSFIDLGCSSGGCVEYMAKKGINSKGVEGDINAINSGNCKELIEVFDFSKEKYIKNEIYDLGYSSEVLEHIEEKYIENYMPLFSKCRYVAITAAPPKWPGFHHVNCQNHEYWIKIFNKYNLYHYPFETLKCRSKSTMNINRGSNKRFAKHRLLFFLNMNFIEINKYTISEILPSKIKEGALIISSSYKELHTPENDTNKVKRTNKHLFKSTIPLISFLKS